jgi:hypothetical protein
LPSFLAFLAFTGLLPVAFPIFVFNHFPTTLYFYLFILTQSPYDLVWVLYGSSKWLT